MIDRQQVVVGVVVRTRVEQRTTPPRALDEGRDVADTAAQRRIGGGVGLLAGHDTLCVVGVGAVGIGGVTVDRVGRVTVGRIRV